MHILYCTALYPWLGQADIGFGSSAELTSSPDRCGFDSEVHIRLDARAPRVMVWSAPFSSYCLPSRPPLLCPAMTPPFQVAIPRRASSTRSARQVAGESGKMR